MKRKSNHKPSKPSGKDLVKKIEMVKIERLRPHPRNYRDHPEDQLDHLSQSIKDNGFYRNVIISQDDVILAGHGVVKAATKMGLKEIPAVRLNVDSNDEHALKVLIGDNEIAHLATVDDRALTELLKELRDWDINSLIGTGFDANMIAALAFVTRPASEIKDKNAAAQWVGMPEYSVIDEPLKIIVSFRNETDRMEFARILQLQLTDKTRSIWWPAKERDDISSVHFAD